jgi:hypothetical protein
VVSYAAAGAGSVHGDWTYHSSRPGNEVDPVQWVPVELQTYGRREADRAAKKVRDYMANHIPVSRRWIKYGQEGS